MKTHYRLRVLARMDSVLLVSTIEIFAWLLRSRSVLESMTFFSLEILSLIQSAGERHPFSQGTRTCPVSFFEARQRISQFAKRSNSLLN